MAYFEAMAMHLTGGCLCGNIRYALNTTAGDIADYCHCNQCRRASRAPVTAWVQVPPSRFAFVSGAPAPFSATHSTRWFCPDCGSQLTMTDPAGRSVGVTLGTLDDPAAVPPTVHGWYSEKLPWLHMVDDLPRYDQAPPYDL